MAGWHHHIAMCLLGGAFLLGLQQDGGRKMPRERFGPDELLLSIGVRKGPPQPDVPDQVWKTRLTGSAQEKLAYAW